MKEDSHQPDLNNYKGIYASNDSDQKYIDSRTGAHFRFDNMCQRLSKLKDQLRKTRGDEEIECAPDEGRANPVILTKPLRCDTVLGMAKDVPLRLPIKLQTREREGRNTRTKKYQSYDTRPAVIAKVIVPSAAPAAVVKRSKSRNGESSKAQRNVPQFVTRQPGRHAVGPAGEEAGRRVETEEAPASGLDYTLGNQDQLLELMYSIPTL